VTFTATELLVAAAIVALVVALAVLSVRRGRPKFEVVSLPPADVDRYRRDFDAIQAEVPDRAQQSAARARGLVEEVLRRMGFPDRVDSAQKARDVASYQPGLARILDAAGTEIRAAGTNQVRLERVVSLYRQALDSLLGVEELGDG
jgi:hypothetical protein